MAEHGTDARYQQHRKDDERPCTACMRARAAYMRDLRQRHRTGRAASYSGKTPYPRSGLGWPA